MKNVMSIIYKTAAAVVAMVIVVIGTILIVSSSYNKKINSTQEEIKKTISYDLQNAMSGYLKDNSYEVQTLKQTIGQMEEDVSHPTLTEEQISFIIQSVEGEITPQLLERVVSSNEKQTEEAIIELETRINEIVSETVNERMPETGNATMGETEKKNLISSITLVVESEMMNKLDEKYNLNASTIAALEKSVNDKIKEIETTDNSYQSKIKELENKIEKIEAESADYSSSSSASAEELASLKSELSALKKEYASFSGSSSNALSVIEAQVNEKTSGITNDISALRASIQANYSQLEEELAAETTALSNRIGSNEQLLAEKSQALDETNAVLNAYIDAQSEGRIAAGTAVKASGDSLLMEITTLLESEPLSSPTNQAETDLRNSLISAKGALSDAISAYDSLDENASAADVELAIENIRVKRTEAAKLLSNNQAAVQSAIEDAVNGLNEQMVSSLATAERTSLKDTGNRLNTSAETLSDNLEELIQKLNDSLPANPSDYTAIDTANKNRALALSAAKESLDDVIADYAGLDDSSTVGDFNRCINAFEQAINDANYVMSNNMSALEAQKANLEQEITQLNQSIAEALLNVNTSISSLTAKGAELEALIGTNEGKIAENTALLESTNESLTEYMSAQEAGTEAAADVAKASAQVTIAELESILDSEPLKSSTATNDMQLKSDINAAKTDLSTAISEYASLGDDATASQRNAAIEKIRTANTKAATLLSNNQAAITDAVNDFNSKLTSSGLQTARETADRLKTSAMSLSDKMQTLMDEITLPESPSDDTAIDSANRARKAALSAAKTEIDGVIREYGVLSADENANVSDFNSCIEDFDAAIGKANDVINNNVTALENQKKELEKKIEELNMSLSELLEGVKSSVATLNEKVGDNESKIAENTSALEATNTSLSEYKAAQEAGVDASAAVVLATAQSTIEKLTYLLEHEPLLHASAAQDVALKEEISTAKTTLASKISAYEGLSDPSVSDKETAIENIRSANTNAVTLLSNNQAAITSAINDFNSQMSSSALASVKVTADRMSVAASGLAFKVQGLIAELDAKLPANSANDSSVDTLNRTKRNALNGALTSLNSAVSAYASLGASSTVGDYNTCISGFDAAINEANYVISDNVSALEAQKTLLENNIQTLRTTISERVDGIDSSITTLNSGVNANKALLDTLNGDASTAGSIKNQVQSAVGNLKNGSRTEYEWNTEKTKLVITVN